jgi:hypothetical protein
MNMPSGMVMATVNVPQTLSASALTNATPRPGQRDHENEDDRDRGDEPMNGLISCLTMSGSDLPPRRVEAHSTIAVVDGAGDAAPATSQMKPGA